MNPWKKINVKKSSVNSYEIIKNTKCIACDETLNAKIGILIDTVKKMHRIRYHKYS